MSEHRTDDSGFISAERVEMGGVSGVLLGYVPFGDVAVHHILIPDSWVDNVVAAKAGGE